MAKATYEVNRNIFQAKALEWAQQFEQVCFLQSNDYKDEYASIDALLALDASEIFESDGHATFEKLKLFKAKHPNNWMFGFFGYDLKNEIEPLISSFPNPVGFADAYFFIPKILIKFIGTSIEIESENPFQIYDLINQYSFKEISIDLKKKVKKRFSKEAYFDAFHKMMDHIKRGDIYEVNLCQEFYIENIDLNPLAVYIRLNSISPTPFSTFFKSNNKYILSASPERFLAKRGDILISQPIKGTARRGNTPQEDQEIIHTLKNNPKEIAENVMIVDLVRNDLTRSALPGTVAAEKRPQVHTFKQVHQLISTITCKIDHSKSDIDVIKDTFPAGSMTGAPKISAMRLCEQYEISRRGVYAGTVGYFSSDGDFDFNVVIRTILYNKSSKYLSFHTGGALTIEADPENEYNECELKASAILKTLNTELE
ncbi:anthranilate synthase component I family protein [Sphingobacterium alkalisoli]|uniref:Anthranilate synthase component I family protein n=1 Tax=Sphingobacterium alkalisoli TaxID=1874115 RepID=A0A4U0GXW0_9SPHI|nr:anthranilate synthase component I family protein [Sphingobacterium alkalisoli]TJY63886.1 anthranilate synthase component I family protein [Sphingobacterium alkalisoli]GGH24249.1 para-aminobenzoate synthase [Sphingobacterium alkalisoli]